MEPAKDNSTCMPRNQSSDMSSQKSLQWVANSVFLSPGSPCVLPVVGYLASFKIWMEFLRKTDTSSWSNDTVFPLSLWHFTNKRPRTTRFTKIVIFLSLKSSCEEDTKACLPISLSASSLVASSGSVTRIFKKIPSMVIRHVSDSLSSVTPFVCPYQLFQWWKKYFDKSSRPLFSMRILRILSSADRWHRGGNMKRIMSYLVSEWCPIKFSRSGRLTLVSFSLEIVASFLSSWNQSLNSAKKEKYSS